MIDAFVTAFGEEEDIKADSDFFDLGGNSLLAARVAAHIRRSLEIRVTVREIFDARTIKVIAESSRNGFNNGTRTRVAAIRPGSTS